MPLMSNVRPRHNQSRGAPRSGRMDKFLILLALSAAFLAPVAVGVAYFVRSSSDAALGLRLATSAYSSVIGILFLLVVTLWPESHQFNAKGTKLLWQLQGIPLFLFLTSLALYPGPRKLHLLFVPMSTVLWVLTFAMSWIHVHGM